MSSTTTLGATRATTTKQRVGLVIAGLYSLANIPGVLAGEPAPGRPARRWRSSWSAACSA